MSKVAALFRTKGMDISVAHVIEAVRLAQVAAALRSLPRPSLEEYNDAVTTVMGFGDSILLQVIREALVISDRMGSVPDDVPKVPLLVDVEKLLKRLRLPLTTEVKEFPAGFAETDGFGAEYLFPPPELARYKDGPSVTG